MSKMANLMIEIEEHIAEGYLSFGRIAEMYEQYGITREDVELIAKEMAEQDSYDDSMDGDFDSAMASAGFGTDEDYGYYGDE